MILYHHRHSTYKNEQKFLSLIFTQYPDIKLIDKKFNIEILGVEKSIYIGDLIDKLRKEVFLTKRDKSRIIQVLNDLPQTINIIKNLSEISIDFTFEINNEFFLFEFNEIQHKTFSDKKKTKVYSQEGKSIIIPKFVQQFIRDIWRYKNLPNFKIVWYDWFNENQNNWQIPLNSTFQEFSLRNTFTYTNFLNQ